MLIADPLEQILDQVVDQMVLVNQQVLVILAQVAQLAAATGVLEDVKELVESHVVVIVPLVQAEFLDALLMVVTLFVEALAVPNV